MNFKQILNFYKHKTKISKNLSVVSIYLIIFYYLKKFENKKKNYEN